MSWDLVTVTHNSERPLREFWSDRRLPDNVSWTVVDNASTDHTVEVARSLGARVIELAKNQGFGSANNIGFHLGSEPHVAFVNPDVRIDADGLLELRNVLERTDCLVAPQLLNRDGSPQPNGRQAPSVAIQILNRIAPSLVADHYHSYASSAEDARRVDWLTGAVVAGRRATLSALGPWDERYFLYYEDVDLGIRAAKRGVFSYVCGNVNWQHGWAREASGMRLTPWRRQMSSAFKFYLRYPSMILPRRSRPTHKAE